MPFIKSKSTSSPTRKKSIFSSNSADSSRMNHNDSNTIGSSLFRRHRGKSSDCESPAGNTSFFSLGRNNNIESDPTIRRARKKVADAEKTRKDADIALLEARNRVREAQDHVQALEQEVFDSAKAKQAQSKIISKRFKGLGRLGI